MLGFGSMRLPLLPGGGDGDVDEAAVAEMVALAMERGANYFDTAYGYHNGNSERVMGRVLSRYPRESWLLASKFPGLRRGPTSGRTGWRHLRGAAGEVRRGLLRLLPLSQRIRAQRGPLSGPGQPRAGVPAPPEGGRAHPAPGFSAHGSLAVILRGHGVMPSAPRCKSPCMRRFIWRSVPDLSGGAGHRAQGGAAGPGNGKGRVGRAGFLGQLSAK